MTRYVELIGDDSSVTLKNQLQEVRAELNRTWSRLLVLGRSMEPKYQQYLSAKLLRIKRKILRHRNSLQYLTWGLNKLRYYVNILEIKTPQRIVPPSNTISGEDYSFGVGSPLGDEYDEVGYHPYFDGYHAVEQPMPKTAAEFAPTQPGTDAYEVRVREGSHAFAPVSMTQQRELENAFTIKEERTSQDGEQVLDDTFERFRTKYIEMRRGGGHTFVEEDEDESLEGYVDDY